MKREPTAEEREKIVRAIAAGDRIGATSMYISITECGLTEAQTFIKAVTTELQLENPEERSVLICISSACRSPVVIAYRGHICDLLHTRKYCCSTLLTRYLQCNGI